MGMGTAYSTPHDKRADVLAYCDADHAVMDEKISTTGYLFIMNGVAVTWNCTQQRAVAISSQEAAYQAAAGREFSWMQERSATCK
jgi:hypothetical protein